MTKVDLSIIVLTHNQKSYTLRLLESLYPYLTNHKDTEVIIVDNASTDGTKDSIQERYSDLSSRINIISLSKNSGVSGGRNTGIKNSVGDTILILDNDTIVNDKALDTLRNHLTQNPRCGIVAPALYSPDGKLQASGKPFPGILSKIKNVFGFGDKTALVDKHPFYVIGACQMFRRSHIDKIGLLDENIFYGPEDADFCMRTREAGYSIDYLSEISIIHDWQRATRRSMLSPLWRHHFKGLMYFYRKHRRYLF